MGKAPQLSKGERIGCFGIAAPECRIADEGLKPARSMHRESSPRNASMQYLGVLGEAAISLRLSVARNAIQSFITVSKTVSVGQSETARWG
jgi:hypothetical protein